MPSHNSHDDLEHKVTLLEQLTTRQANELECLRRRSDLGRRLSFSGAQTRLALPLPVIFVLNRRFPPPAIDMKLRLTFCTSVDRTGIRSQIV